MDPQEDEFTAEELAAFEAGFNDGQPASTPAADAPAPGPDAVDTPTGEAPSTPAEPAPAGEQVDELAGLPPKVRAMLEQFDTLKKAAEAVPVLEHRLRSAEGRVAALQQKQTPAATPPAPPTLPAVERIRRELPEVVDAMEEFFQSKQTPAPTDPEPAAETTLLNQAAPGWEQKVASPAFESWLATQPAQYQQLVRGTDSEPEMLKAVTRFDAYQELAAERERTAATVRDNAAKLSQTRNNRAQAAVVPSGAGGRRAPESSVEAAFLAGFNSQR